MVFNAISRLMTPLEKPKNRIGFQKEKEIKGRELLRIMPDLWLGATQSIDFAWVFGIKQ